jgi:putative aminopeptidase FrvX
VRIADADSLLAKVITASGAPPIGAGWLALGQPAARPDTATVVAERTSGAEQVIHDSLAAVLTLLADLPGAPGHEWRVRDAIRERLPAWARSRASVDEEGNLIVGAGPNRDTSVFIAHLDEVAYEVDGLLADGSVSLVRRGGVIPSAWEGQPALLHFDVSENGSVAPPMPGVFVPRDTATLRAPSGVLTAWFGLDSSAMVARGVAAGSAVMGHKRGMRLGDTRFTARGLDDRAGSLALLRAVQRLDPERLAHHVIFVWSAAEESGLVGASALAMRLGPTVRRVYAIDTFVSSDTPLEEPTFAYAPLGGGPVLRALDDGIAASREERDRIARIARRAGIALQVGTTHGSTDATAFVARGALGAGLSWPGRYSHSPAEVLDLRDLAALVELIGAVMVER